MKNPRELLKMFRRKNKMTQPKLGELIGVTQQFVSLVENGKNKISDDLLEVFKKIMEEKEYEEFEEAVLLDRLPDKIKDKIKNKQSTEIPYFKNIKASAGTGTQNYCDENPDGYITVPRIYKENGIIAVNINGDSMYPEFHDKDIVIIDCSNVFPSSRGYFIVKYGDEIFVKSLIIEDCEIVALRSENPYYKKIDINKNKEFKIIGKVEGVYRKY